MVYGVATGQNLQGLIKHQARPYFGSDEIPGDTPPAAAAEAPAASAATDTVDIKADPTAKAEPKGIFSTIKNIATGFGNALKFWRSAQFKEAKYVMFKYVIPFGLAFVSFGLGPVGLIFSALVGGTMAHLSGRYAKRILKDIPAETRTQGLLGKIVDFDRLLNNPDNLNADAVKSAWDSLYGSALDAFKLSRTGIVAKFVDSKVNPILSRLFSKHIQYKLSAFNAAANADSVGGAIVGAGKHTFSRFLLHEFSPWLGKVVKPLPWIGKPLSFLLDKMWLWSVAFLGISANNATTATAQQAGPVTPAAAAPVDASAATDKAPQFA